MDLLDIEAGVARPGRDYAPARRRRPVGAPTPLALGLDRLIDDMQKGFNGREAWMRARLVEKRRLAGIAFDGDTPAPFTPLTQGGKIVGHTLTSAWSPALRRHRAGAGRCRDGAVQAQSCRSPCRRRAICPNCARPRCRRRRPAVPQRRRSRPHRKPSFSRHERLAKPAVNPRNLLSREGTLPGSLHSLYDRAAILPSIRHEQSQPSAQFCAARFRWLRARAEFDALMAEHPDLQYVDAVLATSVIGVLRGESACRWARRTSCSDPACRFPIRSI